MKSLTIQNFLMLAILFLGLGMLTTSCEQDPCEDITCFNGGSCEDGDCVCPDRYTGEECQTDKCENVGCVNGSYVINSGGSCECDCDTGYEGDSCNTEIRAKFLGSYDVTDVCDTATYNYQSNIEEDDNEVTEIDINTLGGFTNTTVNATITGSTSFDIPNQTDANGRQWTGSGSYTSGTGEITINYTVTFSDNTSDNCEATYTPQP